MGTRPASEDGGVVPENQSGDSDSVGKAPNGKAPNSKAPNGKGPNISGDAVAAAVPGAPALHLQALHNGNKGDTVGNTEVNQPSAEVTKQPPSTSTSTSMPQRRPETIATPTSPQLHTAPAPATSASVDFGRSGSSRGKAPRRRADTGTRASLPPTLAGTASVVLDRRLLQKYEQVNQEIERIVRASQMDPLFTGESGDRAMLEQVKGELRQARKSSSQMIHAQKELLEKMERQERGGVRRLFTVNRAAKMAKLRAKLSDKLSESVMVDEELERLERQSTALSATALGTITRTGATVLNVSTLHGNSSLSTPSFSFSGSHAYTSNSHVYSNSMAFGSGLEETTHDVSGSESSEPVTVMRMSSGLEDAQEELVQLEREKEDILTNLFQAVDMPAVLDLHARIASFSSEIKACVSVRKQADKVEAMYRKALHLLRVALAAVVAPSYSGNVRDFALNAYPLAVEASHLVEASCHVIQPEARRKYASFALELTHVRPPKFPQAVADFARRSRTHYDPHSALAIEGMRNLHAAENVVILLQRLVIQKLETLEKWQTQLAKDQEAAERAHAQMETRLQEQVAVLARSVSV